MGMEFPFNCRTRLMTPTGQLATESHMYLNEGTAKGFSAANVTVVLLVLLDSATELCEQTTWYFWG
jgi:hypothetical protein